MIPVGDTEYRVWDIVIGNYKQPAKPREKDSEETALNANKQLRAWKDDDSYRVVPGQYNRVEYNYRLYDGF